MRGASLKLEQRENEPAEEIPEAPFAPWSVPAALCLAAGVVLAGLDAPLWLALIGSGFLAAFAYTRGHVLLAVMLFLVPLGSVRYSVWEARPNPLTPLMGEEMTFSGVSDGRVLRLEQPSAVAGARVVLSPSGTVIFHYFLKSKAKQIITRILILRAINCEITCLKGNTRSVLPKRATNSISSDI